MRLLISTSPDSALHTNPTCGGLPGPTTHADSCPTATRPPSDTSWTALVLYACSRPFSGRILKPLLRLHPKGFRLETGSEHEGQLNCWGRAPPAALPCESTELRLTTTGRTSTDSQWGLLWPIAIEPVLGSAARGIHGLKNSWKRRKNQSLCIHYRP